VVASYPFLEQPSPILFLNLIEPSRKISNPRPKNLSRESRPGSLGRVKNDTISAMGNARHLLVGLRRSNRAIASSMSPHVSPQQGPTPIFSAATAGGIATVQTVSAAAKTLPTTPTRERQIAARIKGYCTDRAIFTLLRCTTDELFFSCCDSVTAHFKNAATRKPAVPQAQAGN
jgi:hypothetical protein